MRRVPLPLAATLSVALGLYGCNGDDGSTPSDASSGTDDTPSMADLRSALLTLDDMPAGWSSVSYDPESDDNVCPAEVAGPLGLDDEPPSAATQYAASPLQGPSFSEAVQVVPDGRGPDLMPIVDDALAACDGQVFSGRTARVSDLDFPDVGDDSAAYTIDLGGIPVDVVYVVTGDIAIVMSSYDLTGGDPVDLLEQYAARAVDKAERVLG
ncbi:MAG TPA: hypothetical protein VEX15_04085 [Nocardioidaceae bacterium]|nr:hypothetical protein [Nocardioidaceae bacterium]